MSCAALNGRPLWVKIYRSIKSYHRPDSAAPHKADERLQRDDIMVMDTLPARKVLLERVSYLDRNIRRRKYVAYMRRTKKTVAAPSAAVLAVRAALSGAQRLSAR
jgi:hypothetical protein